MKKLSLLLLFALLLISCNNGSFPVLNPETKNVSAQISDQISLTAGMISLQREQLEILKASYKQYLLDRPRLIELEHDLKHFTEKFETLDKAHDKLLKQVSTDEKTYDKNLYNTVKDGPAELLKSLSNYQEIWKEINGKAENIESYQPKGVDNFDKLLKDEKILFVSQSQLGLLNAEIFLYHNILKSASQVLVYDRFQVFSQPNAPTVKLGEVFETEIGLGAYSTQADYRISVNGKVLPVSKDNKAEFKEMAAKEGKNSYKLNITVINPMTGKTLTVEREFSYFVVK